jgi:TolA-binding protein
MWTRPGAAGGGSGGGHRDIRISSAGTELTTAHQVNTSQQRQISQLRSQISNLSAKVADLSLSTDPLANYADVCNTQATNGRRGHAD